MLYSFRILVLLVFLLSAVSANAAPRSTSGEMPIKPKDKIFFITTSAGKPMACLKRRGKVLAGKLNKTAENFMPLNVSLKPKLASIKEKIKAAKSQKNKKKQTRFKNKLRKMKAEMTAHTNACKSAENPPAPASCTIEAQSQEHSLTESRIIDLTLTASASCPGDIRYEITSAPSGELTELSNSSYRFTAGHSISSDGFSFRACLDSAAKCSAEAQVNFTLSFGAFSGLEDSLKRYRQKITRAEARHLLRKISMNDSKLMPDGDEIDLDELINRILDPDYVAPDLKKFLEQMRDGIYIERGTSTAYRIPGTNNVAYVVARDDHFFRIHPETEQTENHIVYSPNERFDTPAEMKAGLKKYTDIVGRGYNPNNLLLHYGAYYSPNIFNLRARYLSPIQARMTHLWAGHFGTGWQDLIGDLLEHFIRDNLELLYENAITDFKRLVLGVTPNICVTEGSGPASGMLCDGASNIWLSNLKNTDKNPNQNFAREFLELYLMGPYDLNTKQPNYNEDDIAAATAYLSGFKAAVRKVPLDYGPNKNTLMDRYQVKFDQTLHNWDDRIVAFRGMPYEIRGMKDPAQFAEEVIDKHPGTARFIAGKIFRMLAYPDPSDKLVTELAANFKQSGFNIAKLIYDIASSEAMFSRKAYTPACVKSPWEVMIENYRNLEFLMDFPYYADNPNSQRNFGNRLRGEIAKAGEALFIYPSVFTYDYCGRSPAARGMSFANQVNLAHRTLGMFSQVNTAQLYHAYLYDTFDVKNLSANVRKAKTFYDFAWFSEKILPQGAPRTALTIDRIIDYFAELYAIQLTEKDREIIVKYLRSNNEGQIVSWNPFDDAKMREKYAGLTIIFSSLSQTNLR